MIVQFITLFTETHNTIHAMTMSSYFISRKGDCVMVKNIGKNAWSSVARISLKVRYINAGAHYKEPVHINRMCSIA